MQAPVSEYDSAGHASSAGRVDGNDDGNAGEGRSISTIQLAGPDWNRRLAYHEAGHAVMACVVGAMIEYVTIAPAVSEVTGPTFGHTKLIDLDQKPTEALVMVALAGTLAEAREMGEADPGARQDERSRAEYMLGIAKLLGKRSGPPTIRPDEEAGASAYVKAYWHAIIAVASALLATPTIEGEVVLNLVKGAVPPG